MSIKIAIDAGHGGGDNGAIYNDRLEKTDTLKLSLEVGRILEDNGIDVFYVRTDDEYETPLKKATDANDVNADYFVSIHRNAASYPGQYSGIETLVYEDSNERHLLASNINAQLEQVGYHNNGITTTNNLVVLKKTRMPAVLIEVGFIDNDDDNRIFDNNFNEIVNAIANGIILTVNNIYNDSFIHDITNNNTCSKEIAVKTAAIYRVQVGAYKNKEYAERMLNSLTLEGFPAYIVYEDNYYKVQVGALEELSSAVKLECRLRKFRYSTYIVYS